jgi:hypothetical protein
VHGRDCLFVVGFKYNAVSEVLLDITDALEVESVSADEGLVEWSLPGLPIHTFSCIFGVFIGLISTMPVTNAFINAKKCHETTMNAYF